MFTTWLPSNITPLCSEQQAPLISCSPGGYMFLSLVVRLFGGVTYSVNYPNRNPYSSQPLITHSPLTNINSDFTSLELYKPPYSSERSDRDFHNFHKHNQYFTPRFNAYHVLQNRFPTYSQLALNDFHSNIQHQKRAIEYDFIKSTNIYDRNEESWRNRRTKDYDFIIVGAGTAGCVLANRLSEVKKWRVLLLEAGPEEPDVTMVPSLPPILKGSTIDWGYRTQPEPTSCRSIRGQTCAWPRGKTMGGSSAINYIVYMRGNRLDYDHWANLGNHGWSYNEMLPYFKKSENNRDIESYDTYHHGVKGPITVERYSYLDANTIMLFEAFKESGLPVVDLTGEDNLGVNIALSNSRDGKRVSMNVAYIKPIRNVRSNIDIVVNALVTKLIIDPDTKTAFGVTYVKNGVTYNAFAKKEVIVSSGSLNSPKLLMLSGIGPKARLESLHIPVIANLAVGKNLQDHVTTEGLVVALSNKTSTLLNNRDILQEVQNYHQQGTNKEGPLSTTGTINSISFIKTKFAPVNAPDVQVLFDGRNVEEFYSDPQTYLETNTYPLAFYNGMTARPLLLTPKSRGVILLNNTDPVNAPPLIYPGFFTVKEDLDIMVEGLRYAASLEKTEAFKRNGAHFVKVPIKNCEGYIWGSYDYFVCILIQYTSTLFHPVGTCKMGPAWDRGAVVDQRLRVYGVNRLRVIDASIMPFIVRGNTNIPTVTIAERASDMIKEDFLIKEGHHV